MGEKQRRTVRGQHLRHLVDHALGHRQGAIPDVDRQQPFPLGVHGDPDPLRRPLQALDGVGFTHLSSFDGTEERLEFVHLHLSEV